MRKSWLLCVLMGTLAWGQAAPVAPPPQPAQAPAAPGARPQAPTAAEDAAAALPANAAVLTIEGICPPTPKAAAAKGTAAKPASAGAKTAAPKTSQADCKTVITKAQFEKLANALAPPKATMQQKKQIAAVLPRAMALSNEAKKEGLDKTAAFDEILKFYKMQILANQLGHKINDEAAKISPQEIEKYYKDHSDAFEQFNLDRIFVPRTKQVGLEAREDAEKEAKMTDEEKKAKEAADKAKAEEAEQAMTKLADDLRARAAAGEDTVKLQKEAFEAAGMKIQAPTVNLSVRRTALSPGHASVFDLKPGEVSQVISDGGGHYIYKLNSKTEMPLEQATNEITGKLKSDRVRERLEKLTNSFHATENEAYFGPGGAGMMPPRMSRPRPGMPPAGPPPQQQAPAPQSPAPDKH